MPDSRWQLLPPVALGSLQSKGYKLMVLQMGAQSAGCVLEKGRTPEALQKLSRGPGAVVEAQCG